ncbi:GRF zinc finger protein [Medicago truncatula]|uniref:GRF zinc finger protein n=1 Tax=Medicago truncatula TaxID=3880 RepID=G7L8X8_MEDTR|nr:GRF zinc finger protein [Medicago truncatula]
MKIHEDSDWKSLKKKMKIQIDEDSILTSGNNTGLRRRGNPSCRCGEPTVVQTVTDFLNHNYGKKFWGCSNYRNAYDKGCSYFKLVGDDDFIDERELKIEKQSKKIKKLKFELSRTRKWLLMALIFGFVWFVIGLVLGTILGGFYLK